MTMPTFTWIEVALVVILFANGVWNTAVGSTGGIAFASLSATLSPMTAIVVQSVTEGISGIVRVVTLRRHISVRFLRSFAAGGLVGAALGFGALVAIGRIGSDRADSLVALVVAGFILVVTWVPLARVAASSAAGPPVVGAVSTFFSMFVGGMGAPISVAIESRGVPHVSVIATSTSALLFQYALRIAASGVLGFAFFDYLPMLVILSAASVLGTQVGARLVVSVDPSKARRAFRITVTLIALSLIVRNASQTVTIAVVAAIVAIALVNECRRRHAVTTTNHPAPADAAAIGQPSVDPPAGGPASAPSGHVPVVATAPMTPNPAWPPPTTPPNSQSSDLRSWPPPTTRPNGQSSDLRSWPPPTTPPNRHDPTPPSAVATSSAGPANSLTPPPNAG